MKKPQQGLYVVLISIHGLVRGKNLELGRDSDTGGQIKYVEELARALGKHPAIDRVDLITRRVIDRKVHPDYAEQYEVLSDKVTIVRMPCGPRRYLRKEVLWPHLDVFVDNVLKHLSNVARVPDIVHAHYADAGYVGARMVQLLGVPLIFTGHSLGRIKKQRLQEKGSKAAAIEAQYNISQRIEAEEIALGTANLVITSTRQEVEEQYELYENYQPRRMLVIPPGVDVERFHPQQTGNTKNAPIKSQLERFLKHPGRPLILAISRPDERKNIAALIQAFGEQPQLRELANLVIIAGNRDDITVMDKGSHAVMSGILELIDKYDLYGHVAYPKHHQPEDVADLYRLAAQSKGVFVNPAFTEPFGLTLIEAAASGVPVVATHDGGPRDILGACNNGLLIDPLDTRDIAGALLKILTNKTQWELMSNNGLSAVRKHYTWDSHVKKYIDAVENVLDNSKRVTDITASRKNRLPTVDRLLICDIDNTLVGDQDALQRLVDTIQNANGKVGFGVATGRNIESSVKVLEEYNVPTPDLLITSVGSEIHYGHRMVEDTDWKKHINYLWNPAVIKKLMTRFPGLKMQPATEQREFKISYNVNPDKAPPLREISAFLRQNDIHIKMVYSHQAFLDLMPMRATKGLAVRYIGLKWGILPERILVAGDSGNDEEMLKGNTLGVVVGNYSKELAKLKDRDLIYFAQQPFARGIIEGIHYYGFLDDLFPPADDQGELQEWSVVDELSE
ncbi:MAG TPA: HAD-IIB family hydrolase [Gammaproteobacteria bacterium]